MNDRQQPNYAVISPEQTGGVPIKCWATETDPETDKKYPAVNQNTILQASMAARLPFAFRHVALMPDAHLGYGLPVGGVFAAKDTVLPYFVGNDIGCGMCVLNTSVPVSEIDIGTLMKDWKNTIPVGNASRCRSDILLSNKLFQFDLKQFEEDHAAFESKHGIKLPDKDLARTQIGTLGGGNHFVELQQDTDGIAHIMIHSGSRGFGAGVCDIFHNLAQKLCDQWHVRLESKACAFLPTDTNEGRAYIDAMRIALDYAYKNRSAMMRCARDSLERQVGHVAPMKRIINIHHNYADLENHFGQNVWVHRKGATLARQKTTGIIPGSMCSKSYIVQGKGEKESFMSCSHGAGRNFSRTEAKKQIEQGNVPNQKTQLQSAGVTLYGASEVHDELGHAYKDISTVMSSQTDLVDIRKELTPVAVLKG